MYYKFFTPFILSLVLLVVLSACTTTKTSEEATEAQQAVKTAKINCQLGMAYLEMNSTQRAKQKLLLALKQAPSIPEPWYSMGYYLESTGEKNEAAEYYAKAIQIAPERGDVQNNYGTYLCHIGKYKESIQHFMLAVKDASYLEAAGAYENAGLCAMKANNLQQAKHFFTQVLMEEPARQVSLLNLAKVNYQLGALAEAKKRLKQFLMIAPPTHESALLTAKLTPKIPVKIASKMTLPKLAIHKIPAKIASKITLQKLAIHRKHTQKTSLKA